MTLARSKYKRRRIRIVWIIAIADHEVTVAAIHHNGIEAENATIAGASDSAFFNRATTLGKQPVDNLHPRNEAPRVDHEVRLAAVVVNRKLLRTFRLL